MTATLAYLLGAVAFASALGLVVSVRTRTLGIAAWGLCLVALAALSVLQDASFVAVLWLALSVASLLFVVLFRVSFMRDEGSSTSRTPSPQEPDASNRGRGAAPRIVGSVVITVALGSAASLLVDQDLQAASVSESLGSVHAVGRALVDDSGLVLAWLGLLILVAMLGIGHLTDREAE